MEEKLRKVKFDLNEQGLTIGDLQDRDADGILTERYGYFYRLGDVICYDADSGRSLSKTVAIIEEDGTGKVYPVAIGRFEFVDPLIIVFTHL